MSMTNYLRDQSCCLFMLLRWTSEDKIGKFQDTQSMEKFALLHVSTMTIILRHEKWFLNVSSSGKNIHHVDRTMAHCTLDISQNSLFSD